MTDRVRELPGLNWTGDATLTAINDRAVAPARALASTTSAPTWQSTYGRLLIIVDALAIFVAVGMAQWIRFGAEPGAELTSSQLSYVEVSLVIVVAWMLTLAINRSRSPGVVGSGTEEYRRVWVGTLSLFGGIAILSMLLKLEIARGYLLIALPTGLALLVCFRWFARLVLKRTRVKHGRCITRMLAVGSASAVRDLAESMARDPWSEFKVVGACVPAGSEGPEIDVAGIGTIPVFGDESTVVGAVTATNSHAVAVTATERLDGRGIRDLSWELEKTNVELLVAPGVVDVAGPRLQMRPVAGLPLIHLEKPQYHGAKRFQKRAFDVFFSATALICLLPLMVVIGVAIRATSKGPAFYRQERVGLNGRHFEMIKFRTMVDGADTMIEELAELNDSDGGVLFKIKDDPRVTAVGRILRKFSLDELPQFLNVLMRDMSVVGPRPPLPNEVGSYDDYAKRRLLVRPGITGLWQVSGRSDLSWEDSVRLDLFYVENWSMVTDLVIALKTAKVVLTHSGAY